jgi:hypothetical protein
MHKKLPLIILHFYSKPRSLLLLVPIEFIIASSPNVSNFVILPQKRRSVRTQRKQMVRALRVKV